MIFQILELSAYLALAIIALNALFAGELMLAFGCVVAAGALHWVINKVEKTNKRGRA